MNDFILEILIQNCQFPPNCECFPKIYSFQTKQQLLEGWISFFTQTGDKLCKLLHCTAINIKLIFSVHANSTSHRWSRLPEFRAESGQIGPVKRPKTANFARRKCPSTNLHNISTWEQKQTKQRHTNETALCLPPSVGDQIAWSRHQNSCFGMLAKSGYFDVQIGLFWTSRHCTRAGGSGVMSVAYSRIQVGACNVLW